MFIIRTGDQPQYDRHNPHCNFGVSSYPRNLHPSTADENNSELSCLIVFTTIPRAPYVSKAWIYGKQTIIALYPWITRKLEFSTKNQSATKTA